MKLLIRIIFAAVLLSLAGSLKAQQPDPFREDIMAFKKKDSIRPPLQHSILFAGSSSFTKWTDIGDYFPGYPVLNRGFGGSSLPDLIGHAGDIIFPYHPKQLVIYCGENDLAGSDTVTPNMVLQRFTILFTKVRDKFKNLPIVFVSLKPSPSRQNLMPKMAETNALIRDYLAGKKNTVFVDVYHKMLTPAGQPIAELFTEDNLHMNEKGYAIWKKEIEPYLLK